MCIVVFLLAFTVTADSSAEVLLVEIGMDGNWQPLKDDPEFAVVWRTDTNVLIRTTSAGLAKLKSFKVSATPLCEPIEGNTGYVASERYPGAIDRIDFQVAAEISDGHKIIFIPEETPPPTGKDFFLVRIPENGRQLRSLLAVPYESRGNRDYDPVIQGLVDSVNQSSQYSLLNDLCNFQTRYSYTQGCENAVDYCFNLLQNWGLSVETFQHTSGMAPNVIATQTGLVNPNRIWIVGGHLDSISDDPYNHAPGADDNGTGSVLTLHCAEILHNISFDDTIIYALWTGEEQGLYGSSDWADYAESQGMNILGYLNFDMVGWVEPYPEDLDIIVNNSPNGFGQDFVDTLEMYTTLNVDYTIDGGMASSDHYSFWVNGYAAFCGIEDFWPIYPYYHTTDDTIDKIDFDFLRDCTRSAVAGLATFAGIIESGTPTPTFTPIPTYTPIPTWSPAPTGTAPATYTPIPTWTPPPPTHTPTAPPRQPTYTPVPPSATPDPTNTPDFPTPTPSCNTLGVTILMPGNHFSPLDPFYIRILICNPGSETYESTPLFAVLDVYGSFFFAPSFNHFDYYQVNVNPGMVEHVVLDGFNWPENAGSADGIKLYSAMTNPDITGLIGEMDMVVFGWSE